MEEDEAVEQLINTKTITEKSMQKVIHTIFTKIQHSRKAKITLSNLEQYARDLPKVFHDNDALEFLEKQLQRYIFYYPKESNTYLKEVSQLNNILNLQSFGKDEYFIDVESKPHLGKISLIFDTLTKLYQMTRRDLLVKHQQQQEKENESKTNENKPIIDLFDKKWPPMLTIQAAYEITFILKRIFDHLNQAIETRGNDFQVKKKNIY